MEYREALNRVVEALKAGDLSIEEIENNLRGDVTIPIEMVGRFHLLFCTKHRLGGNCQYYNELNMINQPTINKWTDIIRSYINEFNLTVDGVRAELDFLFNLLKGDKPSSKRLTIIYFVYYLLDDEQLSNYMKTFVQNLNTADDKCTCHRTPGEFIRVDDPKNPVCKVCGLPLLTN